MRLTRREWAFLGALFLGALVLRLAHVLFEADTLLFHNAIIDERSNLADASYIAGGHFFGYAKVFWKPPLYQYFLGVIFKLAGGETLWVPRLVQSVVDAGSCVLVYLIAREIFSRRVAVIASIAAALNGVLIYYTARLLSTSLGNFLDLAALLVLVRARATGRMLHFGLAGVLLGLAALSRAEMLLFVPIAALYVAFALRRALPGALVAGCALAIAALATINNYRASGHFIPISNNGGVNFYIGTNPKYRGVVGVRPGAEWEYLMRAPERLGVSNNEDLAHYYVGQAFQMIREHPGRYLAHVGKKLLVFWHGYELPSNFDLYRSRKSSPIMAALLLPTRVLYLPFGLVGPLGLLGMVLAWRRPGARLLMAFVAVQAATVALIFVTARFRAPSVPVLTIFAASAGVWLYESIRQTARPRRQLMLAGGALAVVLVGTNCNSAFRADRDYYRTQLIAEEHHFAGTALFANYDNRYEESAREFEAALKLRPMAHTYFNYAKTLLMLGRYGDALDAMFDAMVVGVGDPGQDYLPPLMNLFIQRHILPPERMATLGEARRILLEGYDCQQMRRWGCAIPKYEQALAAAPSGSPTARHATFFLARALTDWASDLVGQLRYATAISALERARAMRPQDTDTRLLLGLLYYRRNDYDRARAELRTFRELEDPRGAFFYGAAHPDNDVAGVTGFTILDAYAHLFPDDAEARSAQRLVQQRLGRIAPGR